MIRAAAHFGLLPEQYLEQVTHRGHARITDFLERDWSEPSRSDHYLMQLALLLSSLPALVWGKSPPDFTLEQFKLPFVLRPAPTAEQQQQEDELAQERRQQHVKNVSAVARSMWRMRLEAAAEQAGAGPPSQGKGDE